jgi:DNA-directed RNA polymerase subunit RPC12/RpoP
MRGMNHHPHLREVNKMAMADTGVTPQALPEDEGRIETHCYLCQQELPDGEAIVVSKCGVGYHDDCAKRAVKCPACGENLLETFLNEETKDKIAKKDKLYTIMFYVIPLAILEILIGVWSIINHPSALSIPAWMDLGFILDLIVLIVGILIAVIIFAKLGYKHEKRAINAIVLAQKGATPGVAEEQLYACGYGDRANPFLLGDVSIPNKVGVQRDNVVRVQVDRLSMTEQGSYIWLNARFLKLLPAKNNPQPSTPEEYEQVWKLSGRTKIMGGPQGEEVKSCASCSSPMEYIQEYDAWYCSACGKYDEDAEGDLPPPPDAEPPPPPEE